MSEPDGDADGLVGAFAERLSAQLERGTTTFRLALAETRLAATSAALLLGIALALGVVALLIWLLSLALAGYGLWRLGLSPALVLGLLLGVHLVVALALALLARRLASDLRFAHTRHALAANAGAAPAGSSRPSLPEAAMPPAPPPTSPLATPPVPPAGTAR